MMKQVHEPLQIKETDIERKLRWLKGQRLGQLPIRARLSGRQLRALLQIAGRAGETRQEGLERVQSMCHRPSLTLTNEEMRILLTVALSVMRGISNAK